MKYFFSCIATLFAHYVLQWRASKKPEILEAWNSRIEGLEKVGNRKFEIWIIKNVILK